MGLGELNSFAINAAPVNGGIDDQSLTGSATGTSSATAVLALVGGLLGSATGVSSATADLQAVRQLSGSADGTSSASADLTSIRTLSGSADGEATDGGAPATLFAIRPLTGSSTGTSDADADLFRIELLTGSATGTSDGTANLERILVLAGSSDGTSGATADLFRIELLTGSAAGTSDGTGTLLRVSLLTGSSTGISDATAALLRILLLSGSATGTSDGTGEIDYGLSGLTGSAVGTSSATGVLGATRLLSATADGFCLTRGTLKRLSGILTEIMLQRIRIQNFLVDYASGGNYVPISYDPKTRKMKADESKRVVPQSVICNEKSSFFGDPVGYRRDSRLDRNTWTFEVDIHFNVEVAFELFEDGVSVKPPILPADPEDGLRQVTLRILSSEYIHPPQQSPTGGSQGKFVFEAQLHRS